jgi:hypothetical protein
MTLTVFPEIPHTAGVLVAKFAVSPEVEFALIAKGATPYVWFAGAGNVMVCELAATWNVCVTEVAG